MICRLSVYVWHSSGALSPDGTLEHVRSAVTGTIRFPRDTLAVYKRDSLYQLLSSLPRTITTSCLPITVFLTPHLSSLLYFLSVHTVDAIDLYRLPLTPVLRRQCFYYLLLRRC